MRLTRRQVQALALMLDGLEHPTAPTTDATITGPAHICHRTAASLVQANLAEGRAHGAVRITQAGQGRYAAERRRA